ncbi:gas vesicle protein GvpG [Natronosporangium hydrolyticum]|uniref:Gas vesicle protein GvpG n=1 Tax=Natronosporangium hydrolyticum TaxID=2811111 RepID=A0A895YMP9_9ACTN|nr:gas vesicle protein GvpG [Natronosporangium hydrolyticum]QSB15188.1 gas vesicle protein GvpG [Natronosporangium hydrolyticum]
MGLFTGLLTLPLAPVRGVVWLGEQVQRQAEHDHGTAKSVSQRLAEIEAAWEAGEISDEYRVELETEAVDDLLADDADDDEDW